MTDEETEAAALRRKHRAEPGPEPGGEASECSSVKSLSDLRLWD